MKDSKEKAKGVWPTGGDKRPRIQVRHGPSLLHVSDSTSGKWELYFDGEVESVEVQDDRAFPGAAFDATLRIGNQTYQLSYQTPAAQLELDPEMKIEVVEERPQELQTGTLYITPFWSWWWPRYGHLECCCFDGKLAPCECKLVIQKRFGWCIFPRPFLQLIRPPARGLVLYQIVWGAQAEQVRAITYCHVMNGGNVGREIRQTIGEAEIFFDPPLPAHFGAIDPANCRFFAAHQVYC